MIPLALTMLVLLAVLGSGPVGGNAFGPTTATLLTISEVCARVPGARGARRLHPATVTRWILRGCPARNGVRVRLTATRAGGRWLIRPADLDAFFGALAATDPTPTAPQRTDTQRTRASERAAAELKRRGA